eukprot:TRINITY_DN17_c0_g1_i5.p1 TRINITY_DN17_c0_g1~~TRINITY_DN17_c0_g1_i5.p1  ORF type:complete len:729 (+),score=167.56 TRINITY_DN17_c0_g1_i5:1574-3760(+)
MANEFCEDQSVAVVRVNEAIHAYAQWGAVAKVASLREKYRNILQSDHSLSSPQTDSTSSTTSIMLDIENVTKVSQLISSEIELNKLLFNVMKIIVETAGAQTGALLLLKDNETDLTVSADYLESGEVRVLEDTPLSEWQGSRTVVEYVRSTGQAVVLGRAHEDPLFGSDSYIAEHQIKSLLCFPVKKQDTFQGVLYLVNNLASFAFPQNRVLILTILTSQLAISLENARLVVRQLENLNAITEERTRNKEAENYKLKLEEFIDTVCHEMRNPLNGIYGGVALLQDQLEAITSSYEDKALTEMVDKAMSHLESINSCAQQQKVIVDDVLDLSKLQSNRIELNPFAFSMRTLITTIFQMLSPQIISSNLDVNLNMKDDFRVVADAHRVCQIILNLLTNALKFTSAGFVEVSAWTEPISGSSEIELHVSVRDTGIGLSDEERSILFQRFTQATRFISSQYGGSGLGLAICKKLIQRMGGDITVESKKWFGSKFSFFIRCNAASAEDDKVTSPDEISPTIFGVASMTILIAEDNAVNQRVLLHYLQQRGLFCDVANNGAEAVQKYYDLHFDLILMDIEMPLMNGLEATRKIREIETKQKRSRVPIIGLSGNARPVQIAQAKEAGMDDYLTKPFHRDDIYRVIEQSSVRIPRRESTDVAASDTTSQDGREGAAELLKFLKPRGTIQRPMVNSPTVEALRTLPHGLGLGIHSFQCRIPGATSVHVIGEIYRKSC